MPKFDLPDCTVSGQGQNMLWAEISQDLTGDLEDMTKIWNKDYEVLDKNATNFIHSLNRLVYSKTFSCLPRFLSLTSESLCGCPDEYDIDNDTEHPPSDQSDTKKDQNEKRDWLQQFKDMIEKAKVTINANIEAWSLKDSFLFVCSAPGLLSVVAQLSSYCLKKRLKNIRL